MVRAFLVSAIQAESRPEEGLARGKYAAPPWVIALVAAVVFVGAIAFLVIRARRARAAREGADVFTPSKRGNKL